MISPRSKALSRLSSRATSGYIDEVRVSRLRPPFAIAHSGLRPPQNPLPRTEIEAMPVEDCPALSGLRAPRDSLSLTPDFARLTTRLHALRTSPASRLATATGTTNVPSVAAARSPRAPSQGGSGSAQSRGPPTAPARGDLSPDRPDGAGTWTR